MCVPRFGFRFSGFGYATPGLEIARGQKKKQKRKRKRNRLEPIKKKKFNRHRKKKGERDSTLPFSFFFPLTFQRSVRFQKKGKRCRSIDCNEMGGGGQGGLLVVEPTQTTTATAAKPTTDESIFAVFFFVIHLSVCLFVRRNRLSMNRVSGLDRGPLETIFF